jgi:hypothetical protein
MNNKHRLVCILLLWSLLLSIGCSLPRQVSMPSIPPFTINPIEIGTNTLARVDEINKRIEELNQILKEVMGQDSALLATIQEVNTTVNAFNRTFRVLDEPTIVTLNRMIDKVDPLVRQLEYGFGLNQETRETVEQLIETLDNAPDKWEETLTQIVSVLETSGTNLSSTIADDLKEVAETTSKEAKGVAEFMGEEVRCTVDHAARTAQTYIGESILELTQLKLFGTIQVFTAEERLGSTSIQPWICHVTPDAIVLAPSSDSRLLAAEPLVKITGFNFLDGTDPLGRNTLPTVTFVAEDGHTVDITSRIRRVSSYRISLELEGFDFRRAGITGTLVFQWPSFGQTQIPLVLAPTPPVADAGENQLIPDNDRDEVEIVTLNGSKSYDEDGQIVSYTWQQNGATLAAGQSPQVLLELGKHIIVLTVRDNHDKQAHDEVIVEIVQAEGSPPVAEAGQPQEVQDSNRDGAEVIRLDGSASSDRDQDITSYEWRENGQLLGRAMVQEVSLLLGTHVIELLVTDSAGNSATDSVAIIVNPVANQLPVAVAGPDRIIADYDQDNREIVQLDGSASYDVDGKIIEYAWYENSLLLSLDSQPQVELPVGNHAIELTVTDNDGSKATDTQLINVIPATLSYTLNYGSTFQVRGGGGGGGSPMAISCEPGYVATGLVGRAGDRIDQIRLQCSRLNINGTTDVDGITGIPYLTGAAGGGGGADFGLYCPPNQALIRVKGRAGERVDQLQGFCSSIAGTESFETGVVGGNGGAEFDSPCTAGYVITSIQGRSGEEIDQINFTCTEIVKQVSQPN